MSANCKQCNRPGQVLTSQGGANQGKQYVTCTMGCRSKKDPSKNLFSHWIEGGAAPAYNPPAPVYQAQSYPANAMPQPFDPRGPATYHSQDHMNNTGKLHIDEGATRHQELLSENQSLREQLDQANIRLGSLTDDVKSMKSTLQMIYKKMLDQESPKTMLSFPTMGKENQLTFQPTILRRPTDSTSSSSSNPFHLHTPQFDIHEKDEMNQ